MTVYPGPLGRAVELQAFSLPPGEARGELPKGIGGLDHLASMCIVYTH
jgi:hypothetical protein